MATATRLFQLVNDYGLGASSYDDVISATSATGTGSPPPGTDGFSTAQTLVVSALVAVLSLATFGGNLLVVVSFSIDRRLRTVSNYFLLSLSIADLTIGVISMPFYSVYVLLDWWPFGRVVCDVWLSVDYTVSNASVANLLVISFDRYFSVTRPLTYRARRTPRRAVALIAAAWTMSATLWTPWIVAWPGTRSVPDGRCYIPFFETNRFLSLATAFVAFYLPVGIMCVLYRRIYHETMERQRRLVGLQALQTAKVNSGGASNENATWPRASRTAIGPTKGQPESFTK